jgi:hypothetical protein
MDIGFCREFLINWCFVSDLIKAPAPVRAEFIVRTTRESCSLFFANLRVVFCCTRFQTGTADRCQFATIFSPVCDVLQEMDCYFCDIFTTGEHSLFIKTDITSLILYHCYDSPPSSAEVKNEWSCTSTRPICRHGVHRDNFTFLPLYRCYVLPCYMCIRHWSSTYPSVGVLGTGPYRSAPQ